MANYQKARVKLANTQLNKLKSVAKNKAGAILRMNTKRFQDAELLHESFLTTRKTSKVRNAFAKNMSTDIKLSKAQISKTIQSVGTFDFCLANLGKKALTNLAILLANLPGLVSNFVSNAIYKFERKISVKGAARAGNRFTLFISNEDMNDFVKVIKSLEDSNALIDSITEIVKHEVKKEGGLLPILLTPLATSLVQPVISSVVKGISLRGVRRAGRRCIDKNF